MSTAAAGMGPIRSIARVGLVLVGLAALSSPTIACERHLHGHQGAQSSSSAQGAVQR